MLHNQTRNIVKDSLPGRVFKCTQHKVATRRLKWTVSVFDILPISGTTLGKRTTESVAEAKRICHAQ